MFTHHRILKIFSGCMLLMLFASCATVPPLRHPEFSRQNVLKLYAGMSTGEVEAILGQPDYTSVKTFGAKTAKTWNGLIYTYNMGKHPEGRHENMDNINTLVFSLSFSPPRLNHWAINLTYEDPVVEEDKEK